MRDIIQEFLRWVCYVCVTSSLLLLVITILVLAWKVMMWAISIKF